MFRKKIGYAIAAAFDRTVPHFTTFLKIPKGSVEHGLLMFFNARYAEHFLRRYGHGGRRGGSIEIAKHRLRFAKGNPTEHRVSRQQTLSLCFQPRLATADTMSDYEEEEEETPDAFVHFAEIGMCVRRSRSVCASLAE